MYLMSKAHHTLVKSRARSIQRFWADEAGSSTIESVIWFPIFAILLTLITNISIVFHSESQLLRVVQDGNRAFSLGRMDDTDAVQTYIQERLAYLKANPDVTVSVANGVITTTLNVPAVDLMPINLITSAFNDININVTAQQIVEF